MLGLGGAAFGADALLESPMMAPRLEMEFLFEREPPLRTVFMRFIYLEMPSSLWSAGLEPEVGSAMLLAGKRDEGLLRTATGTTLDGVEQPRRAQQGTSKSVEPTHPTKRPCQCSTGAGCRLVGEPMTVVSVVMQSNVQCRRPQSLGAGLSDTEGSSLLDLTWAAMELDGSSGPGSGSGNRVG